MKLNYGIIGGAITALILVTILFQVVAATYPTASTAGDTLNASGIPLGALFVGGGVVFLIIAAAILIVVVKGFLPKK